MAKVLVNPLRIVSDEDQLGLAGTRRNFIDGRAIVFDWQRQIVETVGSVQKIIAAAHVHEGKAAPSAADRSQMAPCCLTKSGTNEKRGVWEECVPVRSILRVAAIDESDAPKKAASNGQLAARALVRGYAVIRFR